MHNPIKQIIIVGGGTAGWMSAAYLDRALNEGESSCAITVIESPDIPTVGVGEASIPSVRSFLRRLGIDEHEWMRACDATFKLGIRFDRWQSGAKDDRYWHPFGGVPRIGGRSLLDYWLHLHWTGDAEVPLDTSCFWQVAACQYQRAPKTGSEASYNGKSPYAYHFDSGSFARFLREHAEGGNVQRVEARVVAGTRDGDGRLTAVQTDRGLYSGDLFIDCTGFRGVLINDLLDEPFDTYGDVLLCDQAVALTCNRAEGEPLEPFTTATALEAGWVWKTPLFSRSGFGYVYSSSHLDPDAAERALRSFVDPAEDVTAHHLSMRVGKTRRTWVENCVSIGLSAGFIEPLESTGLWLVEFGLENLIRCFPSQTKSVSVVDHYNTTMTRAFEEVRDFIVLHYCTTERSDSSFWRAYRDIDLPSSVRQRLELSSVMLSDSVPLQQTFFAPHSYACVLAGMGHLPERPAPLLAHFPDASDRARAGMSSVQAKADTVLAALPSHVEYLENVHDGRLDRYRAIFG